MSFASLPFVGLVAAGVILYYLVPKKLQWVVLLLASMVFYLAGGVKSAVWLVLVAAVTWLTGLLLARQNARPAPDKQTKAAVRHVKKRICAVCAVLCFGLLYLMKYWNFTASALPSALGDKLPRWDFVVPMGLSYFIFQAVGYVIDVYRGKTDAQKNPLRYGLFVSFFPQMVQGPISRYDQLAPQLTAERRLDWRDLKFGIQLCLWGYFKKLVIADRLLVAVTALCGDPTAYSGAYVLLGAVFYAAELYADFTGGIDITIGIAQVLGVSVKENFIRPYFSRNIAEYWLRWHISMGTWFKDYIFYPLSVAPWLLKLSKKARKSISDGFGKKLSVYVSTIVTWFLTGLWHGAAWNFVVWGLLNAFFILLAEEFKPLSVKFREKHARLVSGFGYRVFETLRTFFLMCSLRILDCYRDVAVSFKAFGSIFTTNNWGEAFSGELLKLGLTGADYIVAGVGVALMFAVSCVQEKCGCVRELMWKKTAVPYVVFALLALCILVFGAYGVGYDSSQFIYNQF